MSDLSATLAEARDYFLEADFDKAAEKFIEAKAAAAVAPDADATVAANTGLAEVAIQRKDWDTAVNLLDVALAVQGAKAAGLVRARYMLGLARMAQGRAEDARGEFEAALDVTREDQQGSNASSGVRGDIEDRLAQLDELESLEEDDLLEIAMEFGASAAAEEYGPGDDDDEDEKYDDDDEDEENVSGVVCTGDEDDDDEEDKDKDDDDEDEEDEAEAAEAAAAAARKRKVTPAAATSENGSGEKRAKASGIANGGSSHLEATATDGSCDKKNPE